MKTTVKHDDGCSCLRGLLEANCISHGQKLLITIHPVVLLPPSSSNLIVHFYEQLLSVRLNVFHC